MEEQRILLMYAGTYSMKSEDDGRLLEGCVLNYYFYGQKGEGLIPKEATPESRGYQRAKCSIDISKMAKIIQAPAIYDAKFIMTVGSDGKPILKVDDLQYVGECNFELREKDPVGIITGKDKK